MNLAVVVQLLSYIQLSATPWAAVPQAFLSLTILWILLTFITIELVMLPNHFILCLIQPSHPLSSPSPPVNYTSMEKNVDNFVHLSIFLKLQYS